MDGLMQDTPLLISSVIEHAALVHPYGEIVTKSVEGPIERTTYSELSVRSKKLANALRNKLNIKFSDRVGTLAWNNARHMELYYAVSGSGFILHTINPRLFPEQLEYIINHADDSVIFLDTSFAALLAPVKSKLKCKRFVMMCTEANMPRENPMGAICYETLIADQSTTFAWPRFPESTASSLCYTSGTTGNPKGVLYSHRSTMLHSLAGCSADSLSICANDSILLIVPLFHVNAWGIPYSAAMCGAKLVLPGPHLDGKSVCELLRNEKVTFSCGVPTVWTMFFQYYDAQPKGSITLPDLQRIVCGGSAMPRVQIKRFIEEFGTTVLHSWGMTEMSPMGTVGQLLPKHKGLSLDDRLAVHVKQGRQLYGVELKIVDDDGKELPRDGKAVGDLLVRGPWITKSYYREGKLNVDSDNWFATGDVAKLDTDGYMQITDRSKDVIKSGGEWISSIDLENEAVGHPKVLEAAVIAIAHPKWEERPLLIIVPKTGHTVSRAEMMEYLTPRVARWWLPEDVVTHTAPALPKTGTGKIQKLALRAQYKDHKLPASNSTPGIKSAL